MGCASSKVDSQEMVRICKARRRYMRLAVSARRHFAAAHGSYLQALRNTGAALRQFAEWESMETSPRRSQQQRRHSLNLVPPPPPPPPPPLPPPPSDPPYAENAGGASPPRQRDSNAPPPPPPPPGPTLAWDFWYVFGPPLLHHQQTLPAREEEEEEEEWRPNSHQGPDGSATSTTCASMDVDDAVENKAKFKPPEGLADDNSSVVSWHTKDSDLAVVVSASPLDLAQLVRRLDDYFLKAFTGGRDVSMLLETGEAQFQRAPGQPAKNACHPAKVFNALSWSWASRPLHVTVARDTVDFNSYEAGAHGSHCSTMERLYAWEKKLYEEVRCGESTKIEHDKKLALLRKQEVKGEENVKVDKTKAAIKRLESQIMVALEAVDATSAAIMKLRETELYLQLVELCKGLMDMWRTMYECHRVQNVIVQQVNHLDSLVGTEATSDYHRRATIQLEAMVIAWDNSFCSLIKSQREYMHALNGWLRHCLLYPENGMEDKLDDHPPLYALCEEWQLALDRLPDQSASAGIKGFIRVVHAIVVQQAEEQKQRKKSENLSRELDKKLASLRNMERKGGIMSEFDPDDPLAQKKARAVALQRRVDEEKSKHLQCIQDTRAMTLSNLQTGLPNVFQAMTGFSDVCMQEFEAVYNQTKSVNNHSCIRRLN